jgi:hypothetical protein
VRLRERLTPYILLGVLTLGTGLGIGLGLSEAPRAQPATFLFGTCATFSTRTEVGVRCTGTGTATAGLGIHATFTVHSHIPKGHALCLPQRSLITSGPGAFRKAMAYLKGRCFDGR